MSDRKAGADTGNCVENNWSLVEDINLENEEQSQNGIQDCFLNM